MTAGTRIAIADDSQVIRDLIEEIVRYEPEFELVASFDNGRDIAAWVREGGAADVFVIDMRLPGLSGTATISALRRRQPDARILAFSASAQSESVKAAIAAGADDYLLKESSLGELLDAISVRGVRSATMNAAKDSATDSAAASEAGADGAAAAARDEREAAEARGAGLNVLVLDDHDLVREATSALLEAHGFGVRACETIAETRDWLAGGARCDAALIDLRLGDESGADMVAEIRETSPETAVILHSGAADQDGARVARETGADGFLAKGDYTIEEMVDTLSRSIVLRRAGGRD